MSSDPAIVEPAPAPEIFVDGYHSHALIGGVARLTFFSLTHDPVSGDIERRIVLRMNAALPSLAGIHQALGEFLSEAARSMNPEREDAAY